MKPTFCAMPTKDARHLQHGGRDAYDNLPEQTISDGTGNPCRNCLKQIPAGAAMLIVAYRPFPALQPYAETGPIFLCARPCDRYRDQAGLPAIFDNKTTVLVRGYDDADRIRYGTGRVVPKTKIIAAAADILADPDIAYVHVRSSANNCYQCRIDRE